MPGDRLPDTSVLVRLLRGKTTDVRKFESKGEYYISVVVLGELMAGAQNSVHRQEEGARVDEFLLHWDVLGIDAETARIYATVRHKLKEKGRPIPENDVWIAAQAIQHDLVVLTSDAHFGEVDGLKVEVG